MDWKKRAIEIIIPRIGWAVAWCIYLLNRNKFYFDDSVKDDNVVLAFWHGEMLMMPFLYRKLRKKPNVFIISSNHFDGGLIAKMCELFGFRAIRGSTGSGSNKGGVRVLVQSISALKDGADIGIALDGPRGPYHHVADGVIMMSQKTGKKISICRVVPSRYYEFGTWDRFRLPLPFGKICYYMHEGFVLDSALSLQEAREIIKKRIENT